MCHVYFTTRWCALLRPTIFIIIFISTPKWPYKSVHCINLLDFIGFAIRILWYRTLEGFTNARKSWGEFHALLGADNIIMVIKWNQRIIKLYAALRIIRTLFNPRVYIVTGMLFDESLCHSRSSWTQTCIVNVAHRNQYRTTTKKCSVRLNYVCVYFYKQHNTLDDHSNVRHVLCVRLSFRSSAVGQSFVKMFFYPCPTRGLVFYHFYSVDMRPPDMRRNLTTALHNSNNRPHSQCLTRLLLHYSKFQVVKQILIQSATINRVKNEMKKK